VDAVGFHLDSSPDSVNVNTLSYPDTHATCHTNPFLTYHRPNHATFGSIDRADDYSDGLNDGACTDHG
jgi:hypothetical protein